MGDFTFQTHGHCTLAGFLDCHRHLVIILAVHNMSLLKASLVGSHPDCFLHMQDDMLAGYSAVIIL